jgi:hypothetical protein
VDVIQRSFESSAGSDIPFGWSTNAERLCFFSSGNNMEKLQHAGNGSFKNMTEFRNLGMRDQKLN